MKSTSIKNNEIRILITVPNDNVEFHQRGELLKSVVEIAASGMTHLPIRSEIAVTTDEIEDHSHKHTILQNFEPHFTVAFSELTPSCICSNKVIQIPVKFIFI